MSTTDPKRLFSKLVICLCAIQAALAAIATLLWFVAITNNNEAGGWFKLIFLWGVAPWLGATILLFGILPSAVLYFRDHARLDLISFRISSIALGAITVETAFLKYGGFLN
jgi:hypothetical protein